MHTHLAGRGLASALIVALSVVGAPAVAGATQRPPGIVEDPILHPCPPQAPPPVADLGDLPTSVRAWESFDVVLDRSTGYIVHQRLQSWEGTTLWAGYDWDGPPSPDTRIGWTFASSGSRTFVLTVTDCRGRTDSVSHDLRVWDLTMRSLP